MFFPGGLLLNEDLVWIGEEEIGSAAAAASGSGTEEGKLFVCLLPALNLSMLT